MRSHFHLIRILWKREGRFLIENYFFTLQQENNLNPEEVNGDLHFNPDDGQNGYSF